MASRPLFGTATDPPKERSGRRDAAEFERETVTVSGGGSQFDNDVIFDDFAAEEDRLLDYVVIEQKEGTDVDEFAEIGYEVTLSNEDQDGSDWIDAGVYPFESKTDFDPPVRVPEGEDIRVFLQQYTEEDRDVQVLIRHREVSD